MEIHTDQGRNFEAALMKDVCQIMGIHKTRTTAFRPQSDGFVERFNRTLQQMYTNYQQTDWDKLLPLMLTAYRATPQETTGQSPNMLMLGREIMLPVDLVAGAPPGEESSEVTEYGAQLRENMEKVFEAVRRKSGVEMSHQKKLYDRGKVDPKKCRYETGDLVWVAIKTRTEGRAPKLQRKWRGPAVVTRQYTDVTYSVAEKGGKEKVMHFDLLKPYCGEARPRWITRIQNQLDENLEEPAAHEETASSDESWSSASSDDE